MRDVIMLAPSWAACTPAWPGDCPLPAYRPDRPDPDPATEESMAPRDGQQKGAQKHAEGQHGEKAHSRFLEEIHQPLRRDDESAEHGDASESGGDDRQRR